MKEARAIFWMDPGETTGVAWGVFDHRAPTVVDAMRGRILSGSASVFCGKVENGGDIVKIVRDQVDQITDLYENFLSSILTMIPITVGAEHFVLTNGHHRPGLQGIIPAYLLGGIFERFDVPVHLQTAAKGMKWHKRPFHEKYNTWVRGKEHEREAWAHVAARLHDTLR